MMTGTKAHSSSEDPAGPGTTHLQRHHFFSVLRDALSPPFPQASEPTLSTHK